MGKIYLAGELGVVMAVIGQAIHKVKQISAKVQQEELTIFYIARHPQTKVAIRIPAWFVSAYAFSPVDILPDFIPVLGYMDDLFIALTLGWAVLHFTPKSILEACQAQAIQHINKPKNYLMSAIVVAIWIASGIGITYLIKTYYK